MKYDNIKHFNDFDLSMVIQLLEVIRDQVSPEPTEPRHMEFNTVIKTLKGIKNDK